MSDVLPCAEPPNPPFPSPRPTKHSERKDLPCPEKCSCGNVCLSVSVNLLLFRVSTANLAVPSAVVTFTMLEQYNLKVVFKSVLAFLLD